MKTKHYGEKILETTVNELEWMSKNIESEELTECIVLGNKLLGYNYFEDSDKDSDALALFIARGDHKGFYKQYKKWSKSYESDLREKTRDYKAFFSLIAENIEEWY